MGVALALRWAPLPGESREKDARSAARRDRRGICAECGRAGDDAAEACVRDGDCDVGFAGHGHCHGVAGRPLDPLLECDSHRPDTSVDHASGRRGAEAVDRRKLR